MAQLDKMTLQGIRSFDPDSPQWIKFTPLTLILGVNGAGKTTIIEALRFITSGEYPPGSNGGKSWIHDPLLQKNGSKVRAQVKLKFIAADGVACTVSRSLEMITKRGPSGKVTQQLKSLDIHVKRGDAGLGARCADMNAELLSLFNVSKAVLTNVVFCHQEDNCWPLSEGKVLKEKFDQIFGSMEYVKSLDKIKKYRTSHMQRLKELTAVKEKYIEIRKSKTTYEQRKKGLQERIEILRAERTNLEDKVKPIDDEIVGITKKESELNTVISKMAAIKGRLEEKKQSLEWQETTVKEFSESTVEEILAKKAKFEESIREDANSLQKIQSEIDKIDSEIKLANSKISKLENRRGTLQYQKQQNDKYSQQRKNAISQAQAVLGCDGEATEVTWLQEQLNNQLQQVSSQEDDSEPKIHELETRLRKHDTEKAVILKEIDLKQKAQSKRDTELTHLTNELSKIESPAAKILEDSNQISIEVQSFRCKVDESEFFDSIDSILDRMKLNHLDLSDAIYSLKRSYTQLSKESISLVSDLRKKAKEEDEQIKKLNKELQELKQAARTKKEENRTRRGKLSQVINALASCPADFTSSSQIEEQLKQIASEQEELRNEISTLSNKRKSLEKQRKNVESESSGRQLIIREFQDQELVLKLRSEVAELKQELTKQEKQHGVVDITALERKKKELNDRRAKLNTEIGSLRGKMDQINNEIKDIDASLREKRYQTVDRDLRKSAIELVSTELLCNDLNTYYKVLDKAITTFHLRQMESINQLIAHFWRITYQGGDIDTVKIACDESEDRTADAKRRNYNYRVVMVKNGSDSKAIELDMRGRCSAGQKVLASLVIRIALAQIFCRSCSILTLDEPTTNLDRRNIEFLAKAIESIVEDQKGKLQIVIITHDSEFIKNINRSYCENYFEVRKEDGYSTVVARAIEERE